MKYFLTLLFAFSLSFVFAQDDFFDILSPKTYQHDILEGIELIEETVFAPSYEETGDTTLTIGKENFPLNITEERTIQFDSPLSSITKTYAEEGELAYTEKTETDEDGFQTLKHVQFEDDNLGQYMNENKTFSYDETNRITNVKGNLPDGSEMDFLILSYEKDGTLKNGAMDAGMMKMQINRTDIEDTIRYTIEPDLEGMKELFGDMADQMGKKNEDYYDLILDGHLGKYTFHLTQKDSVGNIRIKETIVRNKNFQIIDKIYFDEGQNIVDHIKCSYDGDKLSSTSDLIKNVSYENKYDDKGRTLQSYKWEQFVGFTKTEIEYDKKGNWTQSTSSVNNEIISMTTRKITYK